MPDGVPFHRVAAAFLRRDLAALASQPFAFALRAVALLLSLASLAYLSRYVAGAGPGYLGFWLVGLSVGELFRAMSSALARKLREAQLEGTLEATLSTPAPVAWIVLSVPLAEYLGGLAAAGVVLASGVLLFGVRFGPVDGVALALAGVLSLGAFAALGLLGGAITMRLRRTDPVTGLIGFTAFLLGGVLFPVDLLPFGLGRVAYALPLAPCLDALRGALAGAGPSSLVRPLGALALFIAVVGPLSGGLFAWALRRARVDGSLGQY